MAGTKVRWRVTPHKVAWREDDPSTLVADMPRRTVETMAVSSRKAVSNACHRLGISSPYWTDERYGEVWAYRFRVERA